MTLSRAVADDAGESIPATGSLRPSLRPDCTPSPLNAAMMENVNENLLTIKLHAQIDGRISFAMQQNDVPVIKTLQIENASDAPLRDIRIRITSEPEFADPLETQIDLIREGKPMELKVTLEEAKR